MANILAKPEYMGHTVNFRSYKESFKDKKQTKRPKDEWVIFENTHEAIVDPETWRTAQRCRKVVRRVDTLGEANPLTGLLYCADCGKRLFNHRRGPVDKINKQCGNVNHEQARSDYYCPIYSSGRGDCSIHYISSKSANALILAAIKHVSGYARKNEAEFVRILRKASSVRHEETANAYKKRIAKNEKRIAEIDSLFRKTYEDYVAGQLTENRFEQLSGGYENEQAELEAATAKLKTKLSSFESGGVRADKFIELTRKYTDFTELTAPMLHEFVEKVVVYKVDKSSGRREQQVDIYLNFIGKFDVPGWYEAEEEAPEPQSPDE